MHRLQSQLLSGLLASCLIAPVSSHAQGVGASASGSSAPHWPAFDLTAQVGSLPLQFSDGGRHGVTGVHWSARLAYRPPFRGAESPRRLAFELSATRAPGGGSGADPDPEVTMLGLALRESLRATGGPGRADPFLTAGVSWLRVTPRLLPDCVPPGCMREGGKDWREGRFTMLTLGGGIVAPVPASLGALGVRADGRVHIPVTAPDEAGDSEGMWVELAVGLRLAF